MTRFTERKLEDLLLPAPNLIPPRSFHGAYCPCFGSLCAAEPILTLTLIEKFSTCVGNSAVYISPLLR